MTKTAVILFNLGGPDSKESIEPFLMNFFTDPNIIRLPYPLRWMLAKLISKRRSKREAGDSYSILGNRSPLLENSQAQARALENALLSSRAPQAEGSQATPRNDSAEFKTFVCMRYWHPMADEVVARVKDWGAEKIVLLPLYPQFSTTTTWSSLGVWNKAMKDAGLEIPTSMVCCYPFNEGFIKASAENIREKYDDCVKNSHPAPRVLFSAHGLPEDVIRDGDPYQWQCEQTAEAIVKELNIENLDWQICYQSRVGPKKWIGPSLGEALERAAEDRKAVVIYPHAFTQEHVETLVELDIEYRDEAEHMMVPGYYRAQTVSTHPLFIEGLAGLVRDYQDKEEISGEGYACICPEKFGRCCMRAVSST